MSDVVYATFWQRLGAQVVDGLVMMPLMLPVFLVQWHDNSTPTSFLYATVGATLIGFAYHIGLVAWRGQTLGKMLLRIQIRRLDLEEVGWIDATMRSSVNIVLGVLSLIVAKDTLFSVPEAQFVALNWQQRASFISTPPAQHYLKVITGIWVWSEVLVMLTNARRRALQDFIAGTVVVKK